jgi:IPT/TIG domain
MIMRPMCVVLTIACVLSGAVLSGAGPRPRRQATVSIKVSHETAPAGGLAQLKIRMTDAKPIVTGRARVSFVGLAGVEGISLVSPADDAAGVAVVRGTDVTLSVVSPNGTFGTDSDYPLVTVVGRVPADAAVGDTFPVVVHPEAFQLFGPTGAAIAVDISQGQLVSGPALAIYDVAPGSASVAAGSTVAISGSHFHPETEIRFRETEVSVAHVQYVSSTRLNITVGDTTSMHGMEIQARNRDGSRVTHFSYQRTLPAGGSAHPVLRDVVPLFLTRTWHDAQLQLDGAASGLALQNLGAHDAHVTLDMVTAAGVPVAAGRITVPPNHFVVRELTEVFHVKSASNVIVRVSSPTPVQVLGVNVDSSGAATPSLPIP